MDAIYNILGFVFGPIMRVIYEFTQSYGVAIILFTIFCRLLMLPSAISQQKNQAKNQRMQYKMRLINEKYKNDRQRLQQEQQEFYKREGYNPMSAGCSGGMLLQFPIIFGLISAIYRPLQYTLKMPENLLKILTEKAPQILVNAGIDKKIQTNSTYLQLRIIQHFDQFKSLFGTGKGKIDIKWYDTIHDFAVNFKFLGLDLGTTPREGFLATDNWAYYLIPVMAGVASMATSLYTFMRQRKTNPAQQQNFIMMMMMTLGMPIFSAVLAMSFPVGIGYYWIVSSLVAFIQILVLGYTHPPQKMLAKSMVEETIERRSRENSRKMIAELN